MRLSRANTLFVCLYAGLLVWCYFHAFDDPSSVFYDPQRALVQRYSAVRAAQVAEFIQNHDSIVAPEGTTPHGDQDDGHQHQGEKLLCVGIPSINRTTTSFLATTVGSLLDTLTPPQRAQLDIVVLLADPLPGSHAAYGQPWLRSLADEVVVYESAEPDAKPHTEPWYRVIPHDVRGAGRGEGRVENMRLDHSVLVERCRARGAKYFALVEDDVVASRDWFDKMQRGVNYVEDQGRDWIYLRLFYSEFFMGWNNEEVLDYLEVVFLVYVVVLLGFVELRRRHKLGGGGAKGSSSALSGSGFTYLAALALGLWTPALIALYFLAGRVTMHRLSPFPLSGVREMPRYGCCAQGLVFPRRHLSGLQSLLRDPPYDFAGDQILEGWAGDRGLSKWALDPSVLQHIGMTESSDGPRLAEVWNFSFERQY
jgi:hypothetical protein